MHYGLFAWYMDDRKTFYTTDRAEILTAVVPFLRLFKRDPPDGACLIVNGRPYMINTLLDCLYYYDPDDEFSAAAFTEFEGTVDAAVRNAEDARPGPLPEQNIE